MVRDLELFSKRARLNTPASATDIDEERAPSPDTHSMPPEASTMGVIERVGNALGFDAYPVAADQPCRSPFHRIRG